MKGRFKFFCFLVTTVLVWSVLALSACTADQQLGFSQTPPTLRSQAEKGNVTAQFKLGFEYLSGQGVPRNLQKAAKWLRRAAEQGSATAQYDLGLLYYNGQGVPKNYAKALQWYTKAAAQGNDFAQFNLGLMYYKGLGVAQNYQQAATYYRAAAEQGNPRAQYNLGILYYIGVGVPQNNIQAYKWSTLAASGTKGQLRQLALDNRNVTARYMSSTEIARAQRLAAAWQTAHKKKVQKQKKLNPTG